MGSSRSHWWRLVACLTALVAVGVLSSAWGTNNGKREAGEGKYANLTALWWQWVLATPTMDDANGNNTNPVLDTTGEYAASGQENGIGPGRKYFFLCGTFGFPVVRTVTVPHGKALFFPIVNAEWDNAWDPPTDNSAPELRSIVSEWADLWDPTTLSATLDGEALEVFRTKSPTFSYTLPEANSLYQYFGMIGPQFEGTIKPVAADGYWCYIPPLPPGEYVLHFECLPAGQDNTYFLTVE